MSKTTIVNGIEKALKLNCKKIGCKKTNNKSDKTVKKGINTRVIKKLALIKCFTAKATRTKLKP